MSPLLTDRTEQVRARLSSIQKANEGCLPGPNIPFPIECAVKQPQAYRLTTLGCSVSLHQSLVWLGASSGGILAFNFGLLLASLAGTMFSFFVYPIVAFMVGIAIGASAAQQFALSRRLKVCH